MDNRYCDLSKFLKTFLQTFLADPGLFCGATDLLGLLELLLSLCSIIIIRGTDLQGSVTELLGAVFLATRLCTVEILNLLAEIQPAFSGRLFEEQHPRFPL